jgi:SAM-dependent methyltransferase
MPVYGVQLLLVLLICIPLRLDSALAYLAAHVSNPVTLAPLLWLEIELGALIMTGHRAILRFEEVKRVGLAAVGAQLVVGAVVCGTALALVGAIATWTIAHRLRDARHRAFADARRRTLARYAQAPRSARSYVGLKLRTDPALAAIVALEGNFGRFVDAGCGFLQIGLCLHELGRTTSLLGIDGDGERIAVARDAAGTDASAELGDLTAAVFPEADTFLFVDSLHYLPLAKQEEVLERAARALAPAGRIVVREVDSGASLRSRITERLERGAVKKRGQNPDLGFRSSADIAALLERLGLECRIVQHDDLSIVHNALVVGRRPS